MTHPTHALPIPDTQSERDERHLAIQRVGVKGVRYPLKVRVAGQVQQTAAEWTLDVALPADKKGTHMSRFVAWLNDQDAQSDALDAHALRAGLEEMLQRLTAEEGRIEAAFTFFIRKRAPVSGVASLLDYQGRWVAQRVGGRTLVWIAVAAPSLSQ